MSTLKLKLKRVDPVKYATIASLLTVCLMLIIFIPMTLMVSAIGATNDVGAGAALFGGGIIMIIFGPILYGVIVFVTTLIMTMLLNFILKKTGGLDVDFEQAGLEVSQIGKDFLNEKN